MDAINIPKHYFSYWPLIIATSPPLAYYYAYTYEKGYTSYFGMPSELITVEVSTIISTLVNLFYALLVLFLVVNVLYMIYANALSDKLPESFKISLFPTALMAVLFLISLYGRGCDVNTYVMLGMVFVILFFNYGFPLLFKRKEDSYFDAFDRVKHEDSKTETIISLMARHFGLERITIAYILIMTFLILPQTFITNSAFRSARIQKDYYVAKSEDFNEDMVVLRIYNNKAVLAPFDRTNNKIYPEFIAVNIFSSHIVLHKESVGILTVVERENFCD